MLLYLLEILILVAFFISLWAQFRVQSTFRKWEKVSNTKGLSGYDAARQMLDENGLYNIAIEAVPGALTDHYDPIARVVRLSEPVYAGRTISAIAVACHEVGHAIQHQKSYSMLVLRHKIFPISNLASSISPFLLMAGIIFQASSLLFLGIIFFSCAVAFQLVTLPVEFDASRRARDLMVSYGMIQNHEERGVAKVLNAAALTYVAATLMALLQLIKFILYYFLSSRDE